MTTGPDTGQRGRRARIAAGLAAVALVVTVAAAAVATRPWEQTTAGPTPAPPSPSASTCPETATQLGWSVARRWDEALLNAIRRSVPNPPVHARNLFHLSVAMWDAGAAYDPAASGYLITEKPYACDVATARTEAIS